VNIMNKILFLALAIAIAAVARVKVTQILYLIVGFRI
jgi:hypothetical protein